MSAIFNIDDHIIISQIYKNLGVYYLKILRQDKAYENFKKYLSFNLTDNPDLLNISTFITFYEKGETHFINNMVWYIYEIRPGIRVIFFIVCSLPLWVDR